MRYDTRNLCFTCGKVLKLVAKECECGGKATGEFPVNPDGSVYFEFLMRFQPDILELLQRFNKVDCVDK